MVLAANFGIVGLLGYEIKSSLSEISESKKSLVSSLTINGYGDEEDSPTLAACCGAHPNGP